MVQAGFSNWHPEICGPVRHLAANMVHLDPNNNCSWMASCSLLHHWRNSIGTLKTWQLDKCSLVLTTYFQQQWKISFSFKCRFSQSKTNLKDDSRLHMIRPFPNMQQLHSWLIGQPRTFGYLTFTPELQFTKSQSTSHNQLLGTKRGLLSPLKGHLQPDLYHVAITIIVVHALEHTQHYCVLPSSKAMKNSDLIHQPQVHHPTTNLVNVLHLVNTVFH